MDKYRSEKTDKIKRILYLILFWISFFLPTIMALITSNILKFCDITGFFKIPIYTIIFTISYFICKNLNKFVINNLINLEMKKGECLCLHTPKTN